MTIRLVLLSLLVASAFAQDERSSDKATELVEGVIQSLKTCPARVIVAHFKHGWTKETWGPPTTVKYDIERTNSILYPFVSSVEFSLKMEYGKDHKKKEEAEADRDLTPFVVSRYRNVYKITKDGKVLLDAIQVADRQSGGWKARPAWSDACWDNLP